MKIGLDPVSSYVVQRRNGQKQTEVWWLAMLIGGNTCATQLEWLLQLFDGSVTLSNGGLEVRNRSRSGHSRRKMRERRVRINREGRQFVESCSPSRLPSGKAWRVSRKVSPENSLRR